MTGAFDHILLKISTIEELEEIEEDEKALRIQARHVLRTPIVQENLGAMLMYCPPKRKHRKRDNRDLRHYLNSKKRTRSDL